MGSHFVDLIKQDPKYEIRLFSGDITIAGDCVRELRDIDTVINFSALTYLPPAWDNAHAYTSVNYSGVVNLLKCHGMFKRFVQLTSSHVYGNQSKLPISIDNVPQPNDPYSIAKFAAEKAVQAYSERYGFDYLILRPFNNFGPRQSKDFVIPTFCLQALKGKITVRGDSKREFLYVKDNVRAIKHFLDMRTTGIVQIAKGITYRVKEIADLIATNTGAEVELVESDRPHDIKELWGVPTFPSQLFQWTPMDTALQETLSYYKTRA